MSDLTFVAETVQSLGITIAVAESLTCGALASELGKGDNASQWFAGGLVAYTRRTKFDVLAVDEGPVVTARAALQMATGVRRLLDVDAAVAVTGVGGPGEEEGEQPGTVYVASCLRDRICETRHRFAGDPGAVIEQTVAAAVRQLAGMLADVAAPERADACDPRPGVLGDRV